MSTRALRKAQRQLEEEKTLQQAEEADEESEEEQQPVKPTKQSLFALLNENVDDDEGESENEIHHDPESDHDEPNTVAASASKSNKKKKKKKKAKAGKAVKEVEDKDFDAELALAMAKDNAKSITSKSGNVLNNAENDTQSPAFEQVCRLISVNTQNLHVANEMRRLFGRDAVNAERRAPQARRGQRPQQQQQEGRGFPALSLRRNIFIQGKEEWPRATTGGLGMEVEQKNEDGTIEYRFVHSTAYQESQTAYEIAVASMDHNRMVALLEQNPYHIATLLQVSEIMKHNGQHAEAGDMLERVLFSFGRAVHSTFSHSLSQGKARLDFRRPENREFFLSVWRYIQNISMRSTWRTAYEWGKLLLSLAPEEDPYALSLVMDQYALRGSQSQHYLDLMSVDYLSSHSAMHIPWSLSLAYLQTNRPEEARAQLATAIHDFPHLGHRLFRELDLEPLPKALWSFHEATSPREALFVQLYVTRAKDLWNTPEAKSLLSSSASVADLEAVPIDTEDEVTIPEARHIYLTENDDFLRLLAKCSFPDGALRPSPGPRPTWDPFPPTDNIESYNPHPAHGLGARDGPGVSGMGALGRLRGPAFHGLIEEVARLGLAGGFDQADDQMVADLRRALENLPEDHAFLDVEEDGSDSDEEEEEEEEE